MTAAAAVRPRPVAARPRLLLPPVVQARACGPDPREIWVHRPASRSVLDAPVEQEWPVPVADPAARTALPDPAPLAGAVVLAAVEALSGTRPVVQLSRWVTPEVFEQLSARVPASPPPRRPRATVRSTRVARLSPRVAEATVVVHDGQRVRAAAARLEVHRRAWRVTVLQIG